MSRKIRERGASCKVAKLLSGQIVTEPITRRVFGLGSQEVISQQNEKKKKKKKKTLYVTAKCDSSFSICQTSSLILAQDCTSKTVIPYVY